MKNVNLGILLNIANYKNSFSSNLESIQDKAPSNYYFNNPKNIPSTKYMRQSLTKFHRPLTSKIKSHSINRQKKITKNNDIIRPIPILYNGNVNKEKNNESNIHKKEHEYTYNLLNTTKINLNEKFNGKNNGNSLLKNIISLPEIREENNLIKKSISIINQTKERAAKINNSKNHLLINMNNNSQIMKNNTYNIKIYNNEANNKNGIKTSNNRYNLEEKNNEKKDNNVVNNIYSNSKNVINHVRDNSYDNCFNIMFLRSLENRLRNEHLSLLNSYQHSKKPSNETKNNKNNQILLRHNEARAQNDIQGITNLIITNQKMIPEKNYILNNQINLFESYDQKNNSKIINEKSNSSKMTNLQKYNTAKEKEIIKFPNLKSLYYLILPGNASYLVENCMKHRVNWIKPFSVVSTLYNFKWQELSYGIDYHSLGCFPNIKQLVNHFENHFVISNKAKMFINLLNYCEKRNISVFKYVPFTIVFNLKDENETNKDNKKNTIDKNNKYDNLREMINSVEKHVMSYEEIGQFYQNENYKRYMSYIKSKERRGDYRNINYNEYKKLSKRKSKLLRKNKKRNTSKDVRKKGPETDKEKEKENQQKASGYTLYSDYFNNLIEENNVPIYDRNKEKAYEEENNKISNRYGNNNDNKNILGTNTCVEIPKTHFNGKNMWIVKAINLNRGMCMKIVNSYEQMIKVINKFKEGVDYNFTKEKIDENNSEIKPENKSIQNLIKSSPKNNKVTNNRILRQNLNSADKTKTIVVNKEIIWNKNRVKLLNKNNLNSANKMLNAKTITEENLKVEINKNTKLEDDKKINEIKEKEKLYNCNRIIIQKYIENPLLYKGRKFDMRIWVLLTHTMKVYVFKEGHLKTCSIEYNLNSKDAYAHITNYSFQKYNTNFQKYEKGNEVPFFEFQNFLDEIYPEKNYNIKQNLIPQIKEIIKLTMRSAKYKINKNRRNYQFEIFGYDFMMDSDFNIFLIEINTNPGLEESSPWIKIIVPRMLDDALRLTIDQLFETKYDFDLIKKNKTKEENNLYNNILNSYNKAIKEKDEINKKGNPLEDNKDNDVNNNSDKTENKLDENQIINNKAKNKENDNKQKKYISPFPVPGYSTEENIWDFVCDLDDPDPLDELREKEEDIINEDEKIIHSHKNHIGKSSKKGKKSS